MDSCAAFMSALSATACGLARAAGAALDGRNLLCVGGGVRAETIILTDVPCGLNANLGSFHICLGVKK